MKRNKLFYYYKRKNKRKILKTKIIVDEKWFKNDLKMKGFLYLFMKLWINVNCLSVLNKNWHAL